MDIFIRISLMLFLLSIPLWIYRGIIFARLSRRERSIFRRLLLRQESAFAFGTRIFGVLIVVSGLAFTLIYALTYLKQGRIQLASFREAVSGRFYFGMREIDVHIDRYLYDQVLPFVVLAVTLLLAISFTLLLTAFRDIRILARLRRRIDYLKKHTLAP